jgi:ribosomal protein S18 acetylase RimI-like enzyme
MIVREYTPEDLESALHSMTSKTSERRESKFKRVELLDAYYAYVAEEEGDIKGFIIMESLGDDVSHYMVQINVAEKRKGIGKLLVEKVFEIIGKGGHICLHVNNGNDEAIAFYDAMGFYRCGFIEEYRKGQDKLWFGIDL